MKKILLLSVLGIMAVVSCKKKANDPSQAVTPSFPIITVTGSQYYSIPVGGTLPTITATANDTVYNEPLTVVVDQSTLDNTTPGLYQVSLTATNKYGYVGYGSVYIGVTSASDALDLSGWYVRGGVSTMAANVTKLATGLFYISNVGGVDSESAPYAVVPAVFVVTSDSTIDFGSQQTSAGTLTAKNQAISLAPGDTTLTYVITGPTTVFGSATRVLVKE